MTMRRMLIWLALMLAIFPSGFAPAAYAEESARQALRDAGMDGVVEFAGEYGAQVDPAAICCFACLNPPPVAG